jgi:glycosyltransferase involved in cell wall biosynthesis
MNVLMVSAEYSPEISGGVGTYVQEISTGLSRLGDRVTVLACGFGKAERLSEGLKTVHLLPPAGGSIGGGVPSAITQGILDYNRQMVDYTRRHILTAGDAPDLVQCHNWITFPAAHEIARAIGAPLVCNVQYVSDPLERWWSERPDPEMVAQDVNMFRHGDMIVTVCESMRSIIETMYGVTRERIEVINNAVDANAFLAPVASTETVARLRQTLAPNGESIVLYAGRLNPHKGIRALIESAAIVLRRNPAVRYVIVGEPDAPAHARDFYERLNADPILKSNLLVLGKVKRRQLALLYRTANVAVVPSVYDPFPFAALEAMAAGVPLVASACGGLLEAVAHGETGFLVPVHGGADEPHRVDVDALAESTLAILGDADLARRLSIASERRVAERFGLERMVRRTREVYERTLARCRSVAT